VGASRVPFSGPAVHRDPRSVRALFAWLELTFMALRVIRGSASS